MLEIILIVAVVRVFNAKAKEKQLNPNLWGFIGGVSYYAPILLMTYILLPSLIEYGWLEIRDRGDLFFYSLLFNLGIGVASCFVAYLIYHIIPLECVA